MSAGLLSFFWFVAILVLIPGALWLLKRSGLAAGAAARGVAGAPRLVSSLGLGAQQRVVTLEVGEGDARRWLVLGVTAQQIQTLHTLTSPPQLPQAMSSDVPPFAQVLGGALKATLGKGRAQDGAAGKGEGRAS